MAIRRFSSRTERLDWEFLVSVLEAAGVLGTLRTETRNSNRVAGGFKPPAPTPPGMRVRTGRFM